MENSLTPRPPGGSGWGADSHTPGGRSPAHPPAEGRRGRLWRRGPERTWAQVVGARRRVKRRGPPGSPPQGPKPQGRSAVAALCRRWPPSQECPSARGPARRGRTAPSCRQCLLPPPPPPHPAARSALFLLQLRWLTPNPHPLGPGRQRKAAPSPPSAGWAGPWRARGCGEGGRARDACAATALQRRPRPLRSGAEGPAPTQAAGCGPRVNELDFGSFEGGGLLCTLSTRGTHSLARSQTHAHRPQNSCFPQRGGWGRGRSRGCTDNGEKK